jgi:hypothetical protein
LGKYELGYYAKFGTPEQQEMANSYLTLTGNIIKNASRDFKGAFRTGEQALLNSMKPSAGDTQQGAKAKIAALSHLNQMLLYRSKLASELMRTKQISLGEANEIADKEIDGNHLRQTIREDLKIKSSKEKPAQRRVRFNAKTGDFE